MAIDVSEPLSDGWWLARCVRKLQDPRRQDRLTRLANYAAGNPPLPPEAEHLRPALQAFMRLSRTNWAELVVRAPRERMQPVGIRTAAEAGENGDLRAWSLWRQAKLPVEQSEVHETMLSLGDAYVIVGWDDDLGPLATAEDPRQVATIHDPRRQSVIRAGVKVFHDDDLDRDYAYLYLPGRARVAVFDRKARPGTPGPVSFSASTWNWSDEVDGNDALGGELPANMRNEMPLVRFRNRRGVGEFETHTDLLDRINHSVLRRLVIMAHQAHRQRALKGDVDTVYPEGHPLAGQPVDLNELFRSDPGALWLLPPDVDIWESGQVDLNPILLATKDDVLHLASVTATPMGMFTPDAATQSAAGASYQREGLSYRTEDRIVRASEGWCAVNRLLLMYAGEDDRADLQRMEMIWAPVERHSLGEQGNAWAQMTDVPFAARARLILQASPDEVARLESERLSDLFLTGIANAPAAPAAPAPAVTPPTPAA